LGARLIFDVGANAGDKTIQFLSCSDRVVSVEPSPAAIEILRQRFNRNPRVIIVPKGVGRNKGTASLQMFGGADAYNTFSAKWAKHLSSRGERPQKNVTSIVNVPVTTLEQLIQEYGRPDYVKIDVEGYELEVISGLSESLPLISLECNLPQFSQETIEMVSMLSLRDPNAKYNFCTTEPPTKFESDHWLKADEISTIVISGRWRFMEIFCRSK
jgi:FkbM family methyltransferase